MLYTLPVRHVPVTSSCPSVSRGSGALLVSFHLPCNLLVLCRNELQNQTHTSLSTESSGETQAPVIPAQAASYLSASTLSDPNATMSNCSVNPTATATPGW